MEWHLDECEMGDESMSFIGSYVCRTIGDNFQGFNVYRLQLIEMSWYMKEGLYTMRHSVCV